MSKILITGGAGFIGSHMGKKLIDEGHDIVLLDDLNGTVYSPKLKEARLQHMFSEDNRPRLITGDILDAKFLETVFQEEQFDKVIHLAAHANPGVSLAYPEEYAMVNIMGTLNILLACTKYDIVQLVVAGSSSVYNDQQTPFKEDSYPLFPRSPYGASKAAMETYCQMWHDLHGLPITILRFFSVYGPWGRPDMAPMIFARQILEGEMLHVTQERQRDFTYIDDIVSGISAALDRILEFEIINLGRGESVSLEQFVQALSSAAGKEPQITTREAPLGEMRITYANTDKAKSLLGYEPKVSTEEGAKRLIEWVKEYSSQV